MELAKERTPVIGATESKRFSRFVAVSLFLHALALLLMQSPVMEWFSAPPKEEPVAITIELEPIRKPEKIKQQIVETDLTRKTDEAAPDAFLGQQTQTVDRQTKSKVTSAFRTGHVGGAKTAAETQETAKKDTALSKIGLARSYKPTGHIAPGEAAATNDYLQEVKEGAQTMLNTKEFAYFAFYQRVRRQLEQFWEPTLNDRIEKMIARGRTIASDREHNTRLQVIMNAKGEITRIQVESTSGLMDLDDVAIQSFNKAGPFPNPPKGMVEADGTVRVEWEFVLRT